MLVPLTSLRYGMELTFVVLTRLHDEQVPAVVRNLLDAVQIACIRRAVSQDHDIPGVFGAGGSRASKDSDVASGSGEVAPIGARARCSSDVDID
jgi:hypothetical protein